MVPANAPATMHGDRIVSWGDFSRLSNKLAAALIRRGAHPGDKVAFYLRNRAEYLVCLAACFKARLVHVNVNYRYTDDELYYIFDNSDSRFAIFGEEFAETVEPLAKRLPAVDAWIQAGGVVGGFAHSLDALCGEGTGAPLDIERSPDDLIFVYTGGTTGMPKGVMWRHADLWGALGFGRTIPANKRVSPGTPEALFENIAAFGPGPRQIVACPLMHGTGLFTAILNLLSGGSVCTLTGNRFDAAELFATVEKRAISSLVIVGDAFAKPMLKALAENPSRWDISSLRIIISSGVMWSLEVKRRLLDHYPGMVLADLFGSSEAVGFGSSVTSAGGVSKTAVFKIGDDCKVFTEDHVEVAPGSNERGFIARRGSIPLGYYKDEKKTAETFPTIDGIRYSVPGDWCTVEEDGTLTLLGRGSVCINTAGEKVYPEEVEETLKTHDLVEDALVVGVPDERWGSAVTAIVELSAGASLDADALREHVRGMLASYKSPKSILAVSTMFRAPNGKADYKGALAWALERLAAE